MNHDNGQTRLSRGPTRFTLAGEIANDDRSLRRRSGGSIDGSVLSGSVTSSVRSSYRRRSRTTSDEITVYYNTPEHSAASSSSLGEESLFRRSFTIKISDEEGNGRSRRRSLKKTKGSVQPPQSASTRDALENEERVSLDFETLVALQKASELSFRLNQDGIELVSAVPTPPKKKSFLARLFTPKPQEKSYNKTIVPSKSRNNKKGKRRYLDATDDFHMPCDYY